ncbi:Leucine-rich repeat-containing 9 [Schistosoma japonicum]|uniref:Leucine-rich repeat-containing 9 n=1 Tax=Schistosoma japonicum TaxID=6182 RepID=A0A4Z2CWV1_SCHJA|nr:Leucine-rich repeat-containing 9 [Schistosoma japonicum]
MQFVEEKQFIDTIHNHTTTTTTTNNNNSIITYNHSIDKVNNLINDELILPELSIKKSLMCSNIKFNDNSMLNDFNEYQTILTIDKLNNNNFNENQMNKTKLNNYTKYKHLIQLDNNEKNVLTIKSIPYSYNSLHNHYHHYVKQQYQQCSMPINKSQLMNTCKRPHSRISKVGQLKSFKPNNNNNNNNNNNSNNSLTTTIITTHVDNNSSRRNTTNNRLYKFSAMPTNLHR